MRIARGILALAVACLTQVLLSRYLPPVARRCDLFTVLVVYFGITWRPAAAMAMGTGAGLVEDSLLGALLGLNGFKKTLIAYLVGSVGSLFMLNQAIPRFGILFAATLVDPLAEWIVCAALGRAFAFPDAPALLQLGLGNAVVGLLVFWIAAKIP